MGTGRLCSDNSTVKDAIRARCFYNIDIYWDIAPSMDSPDIMQSVQDRKTKKRRVVGSPF